ncbi:MAG: M23 family metallopeptidase [Bacteroidota bacterium]|nr:M23 family metallopeptidase [Bacteroidota bacterium]
MRRVVEGAVLLISGILIVFLASVYNKQDIEENDIFYDKIELPGFYLQYGVEVDSLFHIEAKVKKNQFLADILSNSGVDYAVINRAVKKINTAFDVRKIKRGNTYHLFKDTITSQLCYFVYEINNTKYVTLNLSDKNNVDVFIGEKTIVKKIRWARGTIESSLWNAFVSVDSDPVVALSLSEIYAWNIDFFDLKKGDEFVVKYEDLYVDGKKIGVGEVYNALLMHQGEPYYSFKYVKDSLDDYYDETGASMRRTFLKAPLRFSRISSRFSNNRYHPVLKIYRAHHGVDYAAPRGTPVYTIGDGVVIKIGYQRRGGGRYVKVKHNSIYSTTYMHLHGFAKGIKRGKKLKQGDLIGYVGSTGLATGPHLDFRVYKHGAAINPLHLESPSADPVDSLQLGDFMKFIQPIKLEIDSVFHLRPSV